MGTVKIIGQNSGLTIRMECHHWQDQAVELEAKLRLLQTRDGHPPKFFLTAIRCAERLKQLFEILQADWLRLPGALSRRNRKSRAI
ncbi:MAG: hypothetical protein ACLSA6_06370 [Holdemania massiliensis]